MPPRRVRLSFHKELVHSKGFVNPIELRMSSTLARESEDGMI